MLTLCGYSLGSGAPCFSDPVAAGTGRGGGGSNIMQEFPAKVVAKGLDYC